jgi:hypothetical protein
MQKVAEFFMSLRAFDPRLSLFSGDSNGQLHRLRGVFAGFFCPTPENVKSVERGFAQVLERFTPVYGISVSSNQGMANNVSSEIICEYEAVAVN